MASTTRTFSTAGYNGLMDWLGKGKSDGGSWQHPATSRGYVACGTHTEYSGSFVVENVFAQSSSTVWHSGGQTPGTAEAAQELRFDFGDGRIVPTHFAMQARNANDTLPTEFRLVASADGVQWDELLHETGIVGLGNSAWHDFEITDAAAAGYRFFNFMIPYDNVSVGATDWQCVAEIEFYGSYSDGHDDTDPTEVYLPFHHAGWNGLVDWVGRGQSFTDDYSAATADAALSPVASSTYNAYYNEGKAIDHHQAGEFYASADMADQWIRWDVGAGNAWQVEKVGIVGTDNVYDIRNFKVQGSADASSSPTNWTDLATVTGDGPSGHEWFIIDIGTPGLYRHYRILSTGPDQGDPHESLRMHEVEMWGYSSADLLSQVLIDFAGTGSESFVGNKVFDLALVGTGSQTITGVREVQNSTALTGAGELAMTGEFYSLFTGAATFPGAGTLEVSGVAELDQSIAFSGTGTLTSDGGRVSDEYEGTIGFAATGTGTVLAIDGRPYRPVESGTWYRKDGRFVFVWGHMRSRKRGYPAAWEAVSPRVRYVDVSDVEDVSWPVLTANSGDDAAVLLGKMRTALTNAGFILTN